MKIEIKSPITGSVWKVLVEVEQEVEEDEELIILESMKMEIPIETMDGGVVKEILVAEGDAVSEGDVVAIIEEN